MDACIYSFFLHSNDGCLVGALLVFSTEPDYINWLLCINCSTWTRLLLLRIGREFLARMDERNGCVNLSLASLVINCLADVVWLHAYLLKWQLTLCTRYYTILMTVIWKFIWKPCIRSLDACTGQLGFLNHCSSLLIFSKGCVFYFLNPAASIAAENILYLR